MQKLTINEITTIVSGKSYIKNNISVNEIIIDSRSILSTKETLFFAIVGNRHNGHNFIKKFLTRYSFRQFWVTRVTYLLTDFREF